MPDTEQVDHVHGMYLDVLEDGLIANELQDEVPSLRLPEGALDGCWLVDTDSVNMNDLRNAKPGMVIRMDHDRAVQYIPQSLHDYSFVAGLISDAA